MSSIIFTAQYYKVIGAIHHEVKPVSTEDCINGDGNFIYFNSTK